MPIRFRPSLIKLAATLFGLTLPAWSLAEDNTTMHQPSGYIQGGFNYHIVRVDSERFNPLAAEARLGLYLEPQVAIEVQLAKGISEGDAIDVHTALDYQAGLYLRLESPEVNTGKLYVLAGYGITRLDIDRSQTGQPGASDFDGVAFGLGGQIRPFTQSPNLTLYGQASRYFSEDDVSIDGLSIGVRYEF